MLLLFVLAVLVTLVGTVAAVVETTKIIRDIMTNKEGPT